MTARTPSPASIRFRLTVKHPPGEPPFTGPFLLAVRVPDGAYVGEAATCDMSASGSFRCRP